MHTVAGATAHIVNAKQSARQGETFTVNRGRWFAAGLQLLSPNVNLVKSKSPDIFSDTYQHEGGHRLLRCEPRSVVKPPVKLVNLPRLNHSLLLGKAGRAVQQ